MRGRPFVLVWREEDTKEALKASYLAESDGALRSRLHALWLLRSGDALGAVAGVLGVHYRSVQRWVAWYRQGGLAAVRGHRMGGVGQKSFLTAEARAEVADAAASGRFHTAAEIRDWIADKYRASYTAGGVYSLLARLRCNPKVPRPINPKVDLGEQEAWKKGDCATPSPRRA
jgi:transposase